MRSYFVILSLSLLTITGCTSPSGVWFDASYVDDAVRSDTASPEPDLIGFDLHTWDKNTGELLVLVGHLDINDEMPQFFNLDEGFYWLSCSFVYDGVENDGYAGATMLQATTVGEGLDVYCHCDFKSTGGSKGFHCDRGAADTEA